MSEFDDLFGSRNAPATAPTANEFEGLFGPDPRRSALMHVDQAKDGAKAAQVFNDAVQTGVNPALIANDPEGTFKSDQLRAKNRGIVEGSPTIQRFVNESPHAADVFTNDMGSLSTIERASKSLTHITRAIFDSARENAQPPETGTEEYFQKFTGLPRATATALWNSPPALAVRAPTMLSQAFGAATGGVAGLIGGLAQEMGMEPGQAEKLRRQLAADLPVLLAATGGETAPKIPEWSWMRRFQKMPPLEGEVLGPEPGPPPAPGGLSGPKTITEQVLSSGEITIRPFKEAAAAAVEAGEVPRPGLDPHWDVLHEIQAHADEGALDKIFTAIQSSEGKAQSPAAMQEYLHYLFPEEKVYIPAEAVHELYEGRVVDGSGPLGFVEGLEARIAAGNDLAVPLAEFMANVEPAVFEKLRGQTRLREAGLSVEDAGELAKGMKEEAEPGAESKVEGEQPTSEEDKVHYIYHCYSTPKQVLLLA